MAGIDLEEVGDCKFYHLKTRWSGNVLHVRVFLCSGESGGQGLLGRSQGETGQGCHRDPTGCSCDGKSRIGNF